MNKRIEELFEQCKTPDWSKDNPKYDYQLFAELIVHECAELCTDQYYTPDGFGITVADRRCHDLIKTRLGVEE